MHLGSEIYQETLVKALAKHFGARLLVVDSLLLPGVSSSCIFIYLLMNIQKLRNFELLHVLLQFFYTEQEIHVGTFEGCRVPERCWEG
jgi:uncharacterized membrane protein